MLNVCEIEVLTFYQMGSIPVCFIFFPRKEEQKPRWKLYKLQNEEPDVGGVVWCEFKLVCVIAENNRSRWVKFGFINISCVLFTKDRLKWK